MVRMTFRNITAGLLLVLGWTVAAQEPNGSTAIFDAIREGDRQAVEQLLDNGADANLRDDEGATALMHAAAFATADLVALLLKRGADVNAADLSGATALMWGSRDLGVTRVLLASGAKVNAARQDGVTPLLSAAIRGKADVARALLAAGADRNAGTIAAPWPMTLTQVALTTNDAALGTSVGLDDSSARELMNATPPPLSSLFITWTLSWRPQPAATNADIIGTLLDAGASANERISQMTLSVPALTRSILSGDADTTALLLERGADPNAPGREGLTPLMAAAVSEPAGSMVRLLLREGARPGTRDEQGATALDWALRLGETPAAGVLRTAGVSRGAPIDRPTPPPVRMPRAPRDAVERALVPLQAAGPGFYEKTRCISCHNQSLPAVALTLARSRGVPVDDSRAGHATKATFEVWGRSREHMLVGHCGVMGFMPNVAYGLFGLAEERVRPNAITDAVASCLAGLQRPDGSWSAGDLRPPLSARGPIVYTALSARALKHYAPPARRQETSARMNAALAYLRAAAPSDTQDEAFKLLGLHWLGGPRSEIVDARRRLLRLQRADGGWGQLPSMTSDAYATGQAMYALAQGGMAVSSANFQRGVDYLRRTQLEDGTWFVRSRAVGFQPSVESGFPHGTDQFISTAATAWAVMALAGAL
jgi:ankyrin repeat protein